MKRSMFFLLDAGKNKACAEEVISGNKILKARFVTHTHKKQKTNKAKF